MGSIACPTKYIFHRRAIIIKILSIGTKRHKAVEPGQHRKNLNNGIWNVTKIALQWAVMNC